MENKRLVRIPFTGFYESENSEIIYGCIEKHIEYLQDELKVPDKVITKLTLKYYFNVNYKKVHELYSNAYVNSFSSLIEMPVEFESLESPKYYNYSTDRIFSYMSLVDLRKIYNATNKEKLNEFIRDRYTSYDGFISFYPNSLEQWILDNPFKCWDYNQYGTLLECYIQQQFSEYDITVFSMMEDYICNGFIESFLHESSDKNFKQYYSRVYNKYRG